MHPRIWTLFTALTLVGCAKKPTALETCTKLALSGCREDKPEGLGAAATSKATFDLPSVPGEHGQVLRFDREDAYVQTEDAFQRAAMLAGPHRYGNKRALVFVQANSGLGLDEGKKLRAAVDAL